MQVKTVIIGSGISGLSVGHFLAKKSKNFIILEADNKSGGIIQSKIQHKFICENGPNTVLLNNDAIIELIKDCNMWEELKYPLENSNKNRFVIHDNKLTIIPSKFFKFISTPLLSTWGKLRIVIELFVKKHNKNTTVYDFISKRFGKEFHDKLIEPFLTGIYAGDTKKMSAKHSLKLLWSLEQTYGSVIKGFLKRKNNKVNSFNFSNGLSELTEKIVELLEENIRYNYKVNKIQKINDGYKILSDAGNIKCQEVICAIPAYGLKNLIWDDSLIQELNNVNYNPIDVFHFGLERKNIGNNIDGFGVLTKPSDEKSFLGVLFNSRIFDFVAPENMDLFTVLVGGEHQKKLCELPTKELERIIMSELDELIDHKGNIVFTNHFKWKNGIPQYNLSQEQLLLSIGNFEKHNVNFHITGNYFNGISVSDCVKKAKIIADYL
jgi:oxygen-dependent protoporphyrinogen oxidase